MPWGFILCYTGKSTLGKKKQTKKTEIQKIFPTYCGLLGAILTRWNLEHFIVKSFMFIPYGISSLFACVHILFCFPCPSLFFSSLTSLYYNKNISYYNEIFCVFTLIRQIDYTCSWWSSLSWGTYKKKKKEKLRFHGLRLCQQQNMG